MQAMSYGYKRKGKFIDSKSVWELDFMIFLFTFYEVISVLWSRSQVLRVNPVRLKSFYCVFFIRMIFFSISSFNNEFIENEFHNLFWFSFLVLASLMIWIVSFVSWLGLIFFSYEVISVLWFGLWVDKITQNWLK
jgi:hypothetical protein